MAEDISLQDFFDDEVLEMIDNLNIYRNSLYNQLLLIQSILTDKRRKLST